MAWQYVGGTSGNGTSSGYTVSLNGTLTGGIASSPAQNDVVVVFSAFGNTASSAPAVSGNNSGAYTSAFTAVHSNDAWDTEFGGFYKVMGASPDTALTITRATNAAYGGATVVHVWRGIDTASPFIGAATPASGNNGAAANPPSYNPAVQGALVIGCGAGTFAAADTAGYTGWGSVLSNAVIGYGNGTTSDTSIIMGSATYAGSAIDPPIATGGTQNNNSSSWAAGTIAFRVGLERVTSDYSDAYVVNQKITSSYSDAYALNGRINSSYSDAYEVIQYKAAIVSWIEFDTDNSTPVTSSYSDAYVVTGRINSSYSDAYVINQRITSSYSDAYVLNQTITSSYSDAYSVFTSQYTRPSSDITLGTWLPSANGQPLYDMINEISPNDSDYIYVGESSSMSEVKFTAIDAPGGVYGHAVRVRARGDAGQTLRIALMQGTTQIATWDQTLTGSIATYNLALSQAEVSSISDYSNLRLRLTGL